MKKKLVVLCVCALMLLTGCLMPVPVARTFSPPAWIQGEWVSACGMLSYTFTTTNIIQHSPNLALNLGEAFRGAVVNETITGNFYSFTVMLESDFMTLEFALMNNNLIHVTVKTRVATIGPALLYRR